MIVVPSKPQYLQLLSQTSVDDFPTFSGVSVRQVDLVIIMLYHTVLTNIKILAHICRIRVSLFAVLLLFSCGTWAAVDVDTNFFCTQ